MSGPDTCNVTTHYDRRGRRTDIEWAFSGRGAGYVEITVEALEELLIAYRAELRRNRRWWRR